MKLVMLNYGAFLYLPASCRDSAILLEGGRVRRVSCHAPSITYVSSTPIANARNGITVTWLTNGVPIRNMNPVALTIAKDDESTPISASSGLDVTQSPVMLQNS